MSIAPLVAVRNKEESWEKQTVYDLENGCRITVEYSVHYGDMVCRIDKGDLMWHCSSGTRTLPEEFKWILDWEKPVASHTRLLVPNILIAHN